MMRPETSSQELRRRWIFLLPFMLFAALCLLFFTRLFAGDPSKVPSALIQRSVPDVSLPALQGLMRQGVPIPGFSSEDLKNGSVTLVNVWASWCGPCREEHPFLMELAKDKNLQIIGLNYKDAPDQARRFLGALGNPYAKVGVDPQGRAAIDWGVYGVPETFLISRQGLILHKHIGPLTPEAVPDFLDKIRHAAGS
jgi:cytochrome c biogenesis protein CcmG, thiol:disulfide interchange protein DsbE